LIGQAHEAARRDRLFYGGISIVLALTVFCGFAPTYYLRLFSGGPKATVSGGPFTPLVAVHAALFTAWVILFIMQTALVASRRVQVHQRLGVAGAVLAAAMVAVGARLAVATAARGAAPPGVDPLAFLAVPIFDVTLFGIFVASALILRRDREAHKRLMLLAYVNLMAAAVARLPGILPLGPLAFFGLSFLFVVAGAVYDLVTRRRLHPVYLWGGSLYALSVPLRLAISGTSAWRALAEALTRAL
jgi:uncharacterized membrane protein YozB (DUF420 family)